MEAEAASRPRSGAASLGLLALVILIWGANWPVMKMALTYMPPLTFAAARMVMGVAIMFPLAWATGALRWPTANDWRLVVMVALMQMAGFTALVITALQYVPAGRSAILAYTTPLWVTPGAVLLLGEHIGRMKAAGLGLGLAGVGVLFNPFGFDWGKPEVLVGNGLLLLAAFLWAALMLRIRGHRWDGSPLSLMPWQLAIAAAILVPTALIVEGSRPIDWSWPLGAFLFYNGPLATAFCFWAIITVNRSLPAITTSLGTLGVPAFGLAVSALALGEPLTFTNTGGLALILSGLVLVTLADRRRAAG
ncbi:DMT family transporter [Thiohalorhabdus methylotrophus]|uniref:DMT family transporter n=1 Tax=Thiohalorhabdus methylotrophus TaxID=3242694 RepID=A0ABV4TWA8_9GAMM